VVKVEMIGPAQASDVSAQVQILESLMTRHVNGIAISPNDPDGVTATINRAIESGIPVITFDSDAPQSKRLCYVGTDNYTAGRTAGREMLRLIGKKGKYAILTGSLGALNLNERIKGLRDELAEQSAGLEEVNLLSCEETTDRAMDQIEELTRANPDLNAWFMAGCWATVTTKGALMSALNNRTDIVIIAFDTVREELLLVQDGIVHALIGQRPKEMGSTCVEILADMVLHNKAPEKTTFDTGVDLVTRENVAAFLEKTP
jgi:ribose transport system substrate-binding protein